MQVVLGQAGSRCLGPAAVHVIEFHLERAVLMSHVAEDETSVSA